MLEATDVVVRYGSTVALDGFTLRVAPGEIVGLVGHNGAGKTTFARVVCGLVRPAAGRVRVAGREPRAARGRLGVAPQRLGLYPTATVRENLRLFGGLAGLRRRALAAGIEETATALHLTDLLDTRVAVLSGGQQRRTQAAGALLHHPPVLLLDEPTAGVDPLTREALLAVLVDRAAAGASVVYTTHYLPELTTLDATIAVADRGRVVARGTARDLLAGLPGEVRLGFDDSELRVPSTDPPRTLAQLLAEADRPVRAVELRQPTLEDLYRELVS